MNVYPNDQLKLFRGPFSKAAHRLVKNQVVEKVLQNPTKVIPTHVKFSDLVRVTEEVTGYLANTYRKEKNIKISKRQIIGYVKLSTRIQTSKCTM